MALAGLVAILCAFPTAAAAGDDCSGPTGDQYCPPVDILTGSGSSADPGDPADAGSDLPFTGLDLGLSLAAGAGLLGAGLAVRRASRSRNAAE